MKNGTKTVAKFAGVIAGAIVAVGGWCFAFGQKTSDKDLEVRVRAIEMIQARWEERWEERWIRVLADLRTITDRLDKQVK